MRRLTGVILEGEEIEEGHIGQVRRLRGSFRKVRRLSGVILGR